MQAELLITFSYDGMVNGIVVQIPKVPYLVDAKRHDTQQESFQINSKQLLGGSDVSETEASEAQMFHDVLVQLCFIPSGVDAKCQHRQNVSAHRNARKHTQSPIVRSGNGTPCRIFCKVVQVTMNDERAEDENENQDRQHVEVGHD